MPIPTRRPLRRPSTRAAAAFLAIIALLLAPLISLAPDAHAAITGFRVASHDLGPAVANDLLIDFTGQYTGSQILINLHAGSIVNHPITNPGNLPSLHPAPPPLFLEHFPDAHIDTHFGHAPPNAPGFPNPFIVGGPVNLDFNQAALIDTPTMLAATWATPPGHRITDQTDFHTLRLALTPDAQGSFRYLASAPYDDPSPFQNEFFITGHAGNPHFEIRDGRIVLSDQTPEPLPGYEPSTPTVTVPTNPRPTPYVPNDYALLDYRVPDPNPWKTPLDLQFLGDRYTLTNDWRNTNWLPTRDFTKVSWSEPNLIKRSTFVYDTDFLLPPQSTTSAILTAPEPATGAGAALLLALTTTRRRPTGRGRAT